MTAKPMLEVQIRLTDARVIHEVETILAEVNAERHPEVRDLVTILTITAASIKLIEALLDLKKRLGNSTASKISVLNADREEVSLLDATEEELSSLIDAFK